MKNFMLILAAVLLSDPSQANCSTPDGLIDMRSEAQYRADREQDRLRCVVFVLAGRPDDLRQGWIEWHHERTGRVVESTRLGLFHADPRGAAAFSRIPERLRAEPGAARLVVLLPTSYWLLVNTTRIGWQMRAGLVDDPDRGTVRKLFTDVGLNAGLGDSARSLADIARLARGAPR